MINKRQCSRLPQLYLRSANNGVDFGSICQTFGLPDKTPLLSNIIGIEKSDELAGGMAERFVPCARRSPILSKSAFALNQSFAFKFFNHLPRSIARRIINCDYLSLVRSVCGRSQRHALDGLPQRPRSIENGNDYTNSDLSHYRHVMKCRSDSGTTVGSLPSSS